VAEIADQIVGAALGFRSDPDNVGLRILAVVPEYRGEGVGRSLLQSFEAGTRRLGATRIALGADGEAGFYVRQGYQAMLLLQWVYGPERFEDEVAAVLAGPAEGMECRRSSFREVPQLFIDLDEPNPALRVQISDLASGAHIGYCMMKVMTPRRAGAE
jgi:hypothetical protein